MNEGDLRMGESPYISSEKSQLLQGVAFNVTHFESRITQLLHTAINTTEHG
jgi:hypothetical protein